MARPHTARRIPSWIYFALSITLVAVAINGEDVFASWDGSFSIEYDAQPGVNILEANVTHAPITADDPLVQKYISLCQKEGIEVAGIEFVEDAKGRRITYDINGTTNYSGVFGKQIGIDGMRELAQWLRKVVAPSISIRAAS